MPFLRLPAFYESFLYLVLHWIVLATSWNILCGYSGYFSFGHGAFYGIGVYTTAVLAGKFDVPFLWTLPAAALVAALLGLGLGAVVFRVRHVRGELFALLTLAATFVLATIVLNTPIDGGPGVYLSAVAVPKLAPTPSGAFYLMALMLAIGTVAIAYGITRARLGLGLFAIHDDEDAAEVMGVPTYGYKLAAFGISCALAGVAGGIQALFVSYVTASGTFNITVPLTVVLMSVLGGTRFWAGPAIGATVITILLYATTAADQAVVGKAVVGAILVAAILVMPEGILGRVFARRRRVAPPAPAPVVVPASTPNRADAAASSNCRRHRSAGRGRATGRCCWRCAASPSRSRACARSTASTSTCTRGEVLGVIGPNGSGKSTLINVVSGHFRADAGSARFGRRRPAHAARAPDRACRRRAHLPDPAAVRAPHGPRQRRARGDVRRQGARPAPCGGGRGALAAVHRPRRRARTRIPATSTCTRSSSSSWRAGSPRSRAS